MSPSKCEGWCTGGQQGNNESTEKGDFRLRSNRFRGTISGLREGELTLAKVDRQLTEALDKIHKGGKPIQNVDFGLCEEKHTKPDQEAFDLHFHFVVSASSRFDCDSKYFDLVGASGCKLRTHITPPENDEQCWSNQMKYLVKEGVLSMNAFLSVLNK